MGGGGGCIRTPRNTPTLFFPIPLPSLSLPLSLPGHVRWASLLSGEQTCVGHAAQAEGRFLPLPSPLTPSFRSFLAPTPLPPSGLLSFHSPPPHKPPSLPRPSPHASCSLPHHTPSRERSAGAFRDLVVLTRGAVTGMALGPASGAASVHVRSILACQCRPSPLV